MFFKKKNLELPPYTLKRYKRAKSLKILVQSGGKIVVTAPYRVSKSYIDNFVHEKIDWIEEKVQYFMSLPQPHVKVKPGDYLKKKEEARELVRRLLEEENRHYKFEFKKVAIRDQKTRWGSCSRNKNLNFSCKLVYLPEELARYVVIHELCHLKGFNHGQGFWDLVAEAMPDYKRVVKELNEFKI